MWLHLAALLKSRASCSSLDFPVGALDPLEGDDQPNSLSATIGAQLALDPAALLETAEQTRRIGLSASLERACGCTGLVKIICKEKKEQKGKRKYHAMTPHPND